jgi:CubicO group peptidase (beta-lactamase class C family)
MKIPRFPPKGALVALGLWLAAPAVAQDEITSRIRAVESAHVAVTGDAKGGAPETLIETMRRLHVPGMSIAVIRDFKIDWVKGYGVADAASGAAVGADTRFQAASISKPVTAMAAVRLAQEKRIDLDQDVNALLRGWKLARPAGAGWPPVTPRSLFSHTAGAADGFGFPGYAPGAALPTIVQESEGQNPSTLGPVRFDQPPYRSSRYSGGGILLMQKALGDVTGEPFEDLMQRLVLRPLGMAHSGFEEPRGDGVGYARAHDESGQRMDAPWHVYPEQAAAGLWTTAGDLARFVIELQRAGTGQQGKILHRDFARQMLAPVGVGDFAVGFRIVRKGSEWYFYHGGSNWGFEARVIGHLRKGYGLVIMTNAQGSGANLIEETQARIFDAYHWNDG